MPNIEYTRGYKAAVKKITKMFEKKADNTRLYREAVDQEAREERELDVERDFQENKKQVEETLATRAANIVNKNRKRKS